MKMINDEKYEKLNNKWKLNDSLMIKCKDKKWIKNLKKMNEVRIFKKN